jgi:hypothetical protein
MRTLDRIFPLQYAELIMTKKETIEELFQICKKRNDFIFDNSLVKDVLRKGKSEGNPYDITKVDTKYA